MKKRIVSLTLIVMMLLQSVMPAFAESRPVYDPLAVLDLLNDRQTPSVNLPTADVSIQMPSLPDATSSPLASRPSELMTGPNASSRTQNMVDPKTGTLQLEINDIFVDALGYDLTLTRYQSDSVGAFGQGWDLNFYTELKMYSGYDVAEVRVDGTKRAYEFVKDTNSDVTSYDGDPMVNYKLHEGHYKTAAGDTLERISKTEYKVTTKTGDTLIYYGYHAPWRSNGVLEGKLMSRTDRFGNTLSYEYDSSGRITALVNGDRRLEIKYNSNDFISEMIDPMGNKVSFTYSGNKLVSVSHVDGMVSAYGYTNNKLTSITEKGFTSEFIYSGDKISTAIVDDEVVFTYSYGAETVVKDINGGTEKFKYSDDHLVLYTDRLGDVYTYVYSDDNLVEETSKAGTVYYEYEDDLLIKKTDIFSRETTYAYEDDLLITETNEKGTTSYVYENRQLKSKEDELGTESFTYNTMGLVSSVTNKAGDTTSFEYDSYGYLTSKDFAGRMTSYIYDSLGRLLTETSPEGESTNFTYNLYGETSINDHIYQYDSTGRVTKITSPGYEKTYTFSGRFADTVTENNNL